MIRISVPRNDWAARAELERQTREAIEVCGPLSMAESFYLARRAEGMADLEARFATRLRDGWAGAPQFRPRVSATEMLVLLQVPAAAALAQSHGR